MPFYPEVTNLNTLDELKNLSHTITYIGYVGSVGTPYPVTITAVEEHDTIQVSGNTISGYYEDSFNNDIYYRNKDDTFTTVNKFNQIDVENNYDGVYHYDANETRTKVYTYVAAANSETKNYTITVTNNWTNGRNQLVAFNNPSAYQNIVCVWDNGVPWINTNGQTINWENNTWV